MSPTENKNQNNNTSHDQKESRIRTPHEQFSLIQKRQSFSFQTKGLGARHGIKIIILLIIIVILTWYGNQPENNPFLFSQQIIISGNSTNISIYRYRKNEVCAIILLNEVSPLPKKFPLPQKWTLFSKSVLLNFKLYPYPPAEWFIIDSTSTPARPPTDWPQTQLFHGNHSEKLIIKKLHPFDDHRTITSLSIYGTPIFIIENSDFFCTQDESTYLKEKCRLLIILHADNELTTAARSTFRPDFCIAFGDFSADPPVFSNLFLCQHPAEKLISFSIHSRNRLVLTHNETSLSEDVR